MLADTFLPKNTGSNSSYFPVQIETSLDQMHTPHQMVGIASDITVNVSQNIKEKIKRGEYVDLVSLLTNNQHNDSKQKLIFQQEELILQPGQNFKKTIFNRHMDNSVYNIYKYILLSTSRKNSGTLKIYQYSPIRSITMRKSRLENVR